MLIIKEKISKALKGYKCDICGKLIERGTNYKRVPFPTGGYTHEHINCKDFEDNPIMDSRYNFDWHKR